MTHTITVRKKTVYGNDLFYPVCETAEVFADISGQKTLTPYVLRRIKLLGYEIEITQEKMEF